MIEGRTYAPVRASDGTRETTRDWDYWEYWDAHSVNKNHEMLRGVSKIYR